MKRILAGVFGALLGLCGLVGILQVLYDLDGFLNLHDWSDGSKRETLFVVLIFALITAGAFFASWRLFRFVAARAEKEPRSP